MARTGQAGGGHRGLDRADRVLAAVEDAGRQDRVRAAVAHGRDEVGRAGRAARGDDRHAHALDDRPEQLGVEAQAGPVAVDRGHEELAGAERRRAHGPLHGVQAGGLAAAADDDLPAVGGRRAAPARVDRDDDGLRAERRRALRDELRALDGGGVERHLVGAGPEHGAHLGDAAHAAADGQRDERPAGRPLDDLEQRPAALGRGGDVEEDDLVGALAPVALGELGRVARRRRGRRSGCP